jgi:hypothetical protein
MLSPVLARLAAVLACAALVVLPLYLWLERRYRPCWPAVLGEPEPAGRGAYREGEVRPARLGRAPFTTRAVAALHLVVAGLCAWDGVTFLRWLASTEGWSSERLLLAMLLMTATLGVTAPLLFLSAYRLLRRDRGLLGVGAALAACAALGAGAMLVAGTMRLPPDLHDSLEPLWLAGALDVGAIELSTLAFLAGARAAMRRGGA